jgi:hypothetical protein
MNANDVFDSVFKLDLAKSADPSAGEMMNRVSGNSSSESSKPMGRPPKKDDPAIRRLRSNVDPDNPCITALATDPDDMNVWQSGSVLRIVFPDGSEHCVVLLNDVRIAEWLNE